jgi:hypothetical protein
VWKDSVKTKRVPANYGVFSFSYYMILTRDCGNKRITRDNLVLVILKLEFYFDTKVWAVEKVLDILSIMVEIGSVWCRKWILETMLKPLSSAKFLQPVVQTSIRYAELPRY